MIRSRVRRMATGAVLAAPGTVDLDRLEPAERIDRLARYEVVSLDVFDTALVRLLERPVDLFRWLADDPDEGEALAARRQAAEDDARARRTDREVTLAEIHAEAELGGTDRELALEARFCRPRPSVRPVVEGLLGRGVEVVFTSDTYFEESDLRRLLEGCGYRPGAVIASADHRRTKRAGPLFDVLREVVDGRRSIHVGDTLVPDVIRPRLARLDAAYTRRCTERLADAVTVVGDEVADGRRALAARDRSLFVGALAVQCDEGADVGQLVDTARSVRAGDEPPVAPAWAAFRSRWSGSAGDLPRVERAVRPT